jgi:lipoprotein-anchoring transpeptidase ErfK/SrfK
VLLWTGGGDDDPSPQAGGDSVVEAPPVDLKSLEESSTYTEFEQAPLDDAPDQSTDGTVVHPLEEAAVRESPGGTAFAKIEREQFGHTWLPVIDETDGWVKVLLPSKPNGSVGWIAESDVKRDRTPYEIRVHLGSMKLELVRDSESIGEWTIGKGKADTPTPTGRTFLLGQFTDPNQDFSPVILPLGAHSPTLDSYGGGPGTVAIHTWPTTDVLGQASSDGCIRVPRDALDRLTEVPLGTLVLVDEE